MNKFIVFLVTILIAGVAFASVNVFTDGTNLGPAQDINFEGGSVTGAGTPVKTVDLTIITPAEFSSDPCATLAAGTIFVHSTTKAPCFCNSLGEDISLYNGSTACF